MRISKVLLAKVFASSILGALMWTSAMAGEQENAVIGKVVNAYGGKKLLSAESIEYQQQYKTSLLGQGYSPDFVERTRINWDGKFDLVNNRASWEIWTNHFHFAYHMRTATVDDQIVTIDYNSAHYQPESRPSYYAAFGSIIRASDTMIAYKLSELAEKVMYAGNRSYLGRPHDMLSFEFPMSPTFTVYVDSESGLISKMSRTTGLGVISYRYSNHATVDGVAYARDFEVYIDDHLNLESLDLSFSVNSVRPSAFQIDRGIEEEPARVDKSEMTVDEISEGIHLTGIGEAYTMFVDAGEYVIGVGGYSGLADRFTAYQKATQTEKPLRYQIVTHHHTDHLPGLADAFELGATLISPANAVDVVTTAVGGDIVEDRLVILEGKLTIGPVEIYEINTNHSESFALTFVPRAGIAFATDHYDALYAGDTLTFADLRAVSLRGAIEDIGITVNFLLSSHGRKAAPWSEFVAATDAYNKSELCAFNRPICR
ncbi:MAG: hypothetical protein GY752_06185 [bacterium]|nr:hypothetical protein [bacterium]